MTSGAGLASGTRLAGGARLASRTRLASGARLSGLSGLGGLGGLSGLSGLRGSRGSRGSRGRGRRATTSGGRMTIGDGVDERSEVDGTETGEWIPTLSGVESVGAAGLGARVSSAAVVLTRSDIVEG